MNREADLAEFCDRRAAAASSLPRGCGCSLKTGGRCGRWGLDSTHACWTSSNVRAYPVGQVIAPPGTTPRNARRSLASAPAAWRASPIAWCRTSRGGTPARFPRDACLGVGVPAERAPVDSLPHYSVTAPLQPVLTHSDLVSCRSSLTARLESHPVNGRRLEASDRDRRPPMEDHSSVKNGQNVPRALCDWPFGLRGYSSCCAHI